MKKKNIKKQVEPAKLIILSYLNARYLKILDKDVRYNNKTYDIYEPIDQFRHFSKGYTGVTVDYIRKYLFNNKINKDILMSILMELLKKEKLNVIYCSNIKRLVFENRRHTQHSLYTLKYFVDYMVNNKGYINYDEVRKFYKVYSILRSNLFDNNND